MKEKLKYSVDIDRDNLIDRSINEWVLLWCKKYHPEAFEEASRFVKGLLNKKGLNHE